MGSSPIEKSQGREKRRVLNRNSISTRSWIVTNPAFPSGISVETTCRDRGSAGNARGYTKICKIKAVPAREIAPIKTFVVGTYFAPRERERERERKRERGRRKEKRRNVIKRSTYFYKRDESSGNSVVRR